MRKAVLKGFSERTMDTVRDRPLTSFSICTVYVKPFTIENVLVRTYALSSSIAHPSCTTSHFCFPTEIPPVHFYKDPCARTTTAVFLNWITSDLNH